MSLMSGLTALLFTTLTFSLTLHSAGWVRSGWQAAAGATFGMVPLIKREITGQIAGSVGAYGNVGGVVYLTELTPTGCAD